MNVKLIFLMLTLSLCCWSCASPSTTLEERAPAAASVFYWELDQAEKELDSLRTQYQRANFSSDAVKILDTFAKGIQIDIKQARYDMARFDAGPDVSILHAVGDNTLALYDDLADLRIISFPQR
ncbi:MAG: hypothetical protein COA70_04840 [Planctomycetota bacterium]|nr:MAG: hypothetical protein COA70_04840 [Planctomycetota bacterium]